MFQILSKVGDRRPTQGRPQRRNTKKKNHASPQYISENKCDTFVNFEGQKSRRNTFLSILDLVKVLWLLRGAGTQVAK